MIGNRVVNGVLDTSTRALLQDNWKVKVIKRCDIGCSGDNRW